MVRIGTADGRLYLSKISDVKIANKTSTRMILEFIDANTKRKIRVYLDDLSSGKFEGKIDQETFLAIIHPDVH